MLKELQNYFLGRNILDYYQERIKSHPEKIKQLKKERNNYLVYGKFLPNLITTFGIGMGLAAIVEGSLPEAVGSGMIIAMGEGGRNLTNEDFSFKKIDYAKEDYCNEVDKLTTPKALEMIRKSLEKKI